MNNAFVRQDKTAILFIPHTEKKQKTDTTTYVRYKPPGK